MTTENLQLVTVMHTFVLLVISHILGDMIFNSYRLAVRKRNPGIYNQALAVGGHSLLHALFACLLLGLFARSWLTAALLVFGFHFSIDFIRCRVEMGLYGANRIYVKRSELFAWVGGRAENPAKMNISNLWPWLLIHFLDQVAHLGSLYGISLVV